MLEKNHRDLKGELEELVVLDRSLCASLKEVEGELKSLQRKRSQLKR